MMVHRGGALTTLSGVAVLLSAVLMAYWYWDSPVQLMRYFYSAFLLLALLVVTRHLWYSSVGGAFVRRFRRKREENGRHTPDTDDCKNREKNEARQKAQMIHKEKAKDFEERITAPRREHKLQLLEEKMKFIRGFQGEGSMVGSRTNGRQRGEESRLLKEHDELARRRTEESEGMGGEVIGTEESDSDGDEENEEGKVITIALKLPTQSVKKQFKTSYKVKALYRWLQSLKFSPRLYCLATVLPRQPLVDLHHTLEQCGLTSDTALVVEERDT